jgi:hypothetical protein
VRRQLVLQKGVNAVSGAAASTLSNRNDLGAHRIATTTPFWLVASPIANRTPALFPLIPAGSLTFIWSTRAVSGAEPAKSISPPCPPMETRTGATGWEYGSAAAFPVILGGFVTPCPVANRVTMLPAGAGFSAEFSDPSALKTPGYSKRPRISIRRESQTREQQHESREDMRVHIEQGIQ